MLLLLRRAFLIRLRFQIRGFSVWQSIADSQQLKYLTHHRRALLENIAVDVAHVSSDEGAEHLHHFGPRAHLSLQIRRVHIRTATLCENNLSRGFLASNNLLTWWEFRHLACAWWHTLATVELSARKYETRIAPPQRYLLGGHNHRARMVCVAASPTQGTPNTPPPSPVRCMYWCLKDA